MTFKDTRATILAVKVLGLLLAIIAIFHLEAISLDAVNAFINSFIDEETCIRYPTGFTTDKGKALKLLRALYGLWRAPLLWQD